MKTKKDHKTTNIVCGYKIRDVETGLFACKGLYYWTKKGKIWSNIGHLKNALRNKFGDDYVKQIPWNWEIVVCCELPLTQIPLRTVVCLQGKDINLLALEQHSESLKERQNATQCKDGDCCTQRPEHEEGKDCSASSPRSDEVPS